jgi:pSer/pThr/pTyr-binding forkhead associated (FHA) protein
MEAKLIVVSGKTSRGEIALKLPATIGRSRQATLTVAHPMISRRHCEIYESDGLLMLRDLGSLNGVLLDGKRVTAAPLPPGTVFTVGPLTLRVEYEYAGDLSALPPIEEHVEPAAAEDTLPVAAMNDTTDVPATPVDETVPAPQPSAVEELAAEQFQPVEEAAVEQPQAVEPDDDDLGFSFMDESPQPSAAEGTPLESAAPVREEDAPSAESETTQFEQPAEAETIQFEDAATEPEAATESETMEFEPVAEGDEPAGETDVSSAAPTRGRDAKKKAAGWWPFAGKGAEKDSKTAKKSPPAKPAAPAKPAKKVETPAAKKPAPQEVDFDELAFAALQDDPEGTAPKPSAAKKSPAKPDDEDLDSFLQNLE